MVALLAPAVSARPTLTDPSDRTPLLELIGEVIEAGLELGDALGKAVALGAGRCHLDFELGGHSSSGGKTRGEPHEHQA